MGLHFSVIPTQVFLMSTLVKHHILKPNKFDLALCKAEFLAYLRAYKTSCLGVQNTNGGDLSRIIKIILGLKSTVCASMVGHVGRAN